MELRPISPEMAPQVARIAADIHKEREESYLLCETALARARELHDDAAFITLALEYALVIDQRGFPDESIDILYEALQLTQSYHLYSEEARLLNLIGRAVYTRAEYRRAMQAWALSLEVSALAGDMASWAFAKLGIAQIYDALEDHDTAVTILREAQLEAVKLDNRVLTFNIYLNLGVNLFRIERMDEAQGCYEKALEISRSMGHLDDLGETEFRMAELEFACGDTAAALKLLESAEPLCTQSNHGWALANIHMLRAAIYMQRQLVAHAASEIEAGLELARKTGSQHIELRLMQLKSRFAREQRDFEGALNYYQMAQTLFDQIHPRDPRRELYELEDIAGLRPSMGRMLLTLANDPALEQTDLKSLAQLLCSKAVDIFPISTASYWLAEQPATELTCLYRTADPDGPQAAGMQLAGPSAQPLISSLARGENLIAHNVQQHQSIWPVYEGFFSGCQIVSALVLPLRLHDQLFGALMLECMVSQHNWSNDEVMYANQLALIATRALAGMEQERYRKHIATLNNALQQNNEELERRVTERTEALEKAMQQLVQSEKLAALGNLVAGVAHELNTPLGNMLTAASTLHDKQQELADHLAQGKLKRSLFTEFMQETSMISQLIKRNAFRASDLIRDLKQLAPDATESQPCDFRLALLLEHALSQLSPVPQHRGIHIEKDIDPELILHGQPDALEQVVRHLLNNALTHAFDQQPSPTLLIAAYPLDEHLALLRIADNGCGIAPENLDKVFEPFFTTRFGQGSNGLGLYIVYSLVTGTLGGTISLANRAEGGLEVMLTLPRQAPGGRNQNGSK